MRRRTRRIGSKPAELGSGNLLLESGFGRVESSGIGMLSLRTPEPISFRVPGRYWLSRNSIQPAGVSLVESTSAAEAAEELHGVGRSDIEDGWR